MSNCYVFDGTTWEWKTYMFYNRAAAAASMSKEGWRITGGLPAQRRTKTEVYDEKWNVWREGPEMPWEMSAHCQVTSSAGVIVAGENEYKMIY